MNNINPVYQSILDKLPESLHAVILPELQKMDQGVNSKLQEVRDQYKGYEGYEQIVKAGVNPQFVAQAVQLAQELQRDPKSLVEKINDNWNLGYVDGSTVQQSSVEDEPFGNDDIANNPVVKQLMTQIETLTTQQQQEKEQQEYEQALAQWEQDLDQFLADKPGVNRTLITAFMSSDDNMTFEQAYDEYKNLVAGSVTVDSVQQQQSPPSTPNAPVVMGGDGTSGSGIPQDPINFGGMSKNDLNSSVEAMILAAQQNNQG